MKKCILVITDGIGINTKNTPNAFNTACKPTYEWLYKNALTGTLKTSGLAVGLPEGQMGNSEVGHMTIGSGRIIYQNLVKIDRAVADGTLASNPAISNLLARVKRLHVIGLYSDGGVHSHLSHFDAVCEAGEKAGVEVFAHAITDGRDVSPKSALNFISSLEKKHKIATVSGRFWAMDRDKRWERVEKAYKTIAQNANLRSDKPSDYIKASYEKGEFDEFVEPASFCEFGGIRASDGIVFVNFRNDRAREICAALAVKEFCEFARETVCENLVTMTKYDDKFTFPVAFVSEDLADTLSDVIARAGGRQFHTAETEKYAHVTFFFNGGREEAVENETRLLVPSPKVATYDLAPEMSAAAVADGVVKALQAGYEFVVVNFANGDMVGHTGNFEAAVKAVEAVDAALGRVVAAARENGYSYMQISDHGNCEEMADEEGNVLTNHTTYDVPVFVLADGVSGLKEGGLANVAASVLELMGVEVPEVMERSIF